ncbi:HAD family hydrolase [Streptomyces sp. DT20]|uniref:HAD family hydrolase n=1 Tax=unclassified Streptomyces TaxID=2593676 RepID=UPI002E28DB04|nr:HAD-IA family hydrolase [Streptomyces sp. NBC_00304]WRZ09293.1 HAD-IA family hydrolase [Streptomyces sp. NBC_00341]WRZ09468.1 HAD-IA family hydrolase [Streptomyces sp. NBC_00341]
MTTSHPSGRAFDAVLCDFDNVIRFYDTTRLTSLERLAGLAPGTTMEVAFAPETDLPLLLGEITQKQWVESIALGLSCRVPRARAHELGAALAEAPFRADEAVVGLLRRARAHMPLVLVTNATLELESDLVSLGLADFADHVVSSARVGVAKPDPKIYEIAAERAGVTVDRCLFVDDRLENIEAAVALGMTGVHYRGPADLQSALGSLLDG